jgi:hypothetical protein
MKKRVSILPIIFVVGSIAYVSWNYFHRPAMPKDISFADFQQYVHQDQVESLVIDGNTATGQLKAGAPFKGSFRTQITATKSATTHDQSGAKQLPSNPVDLARDLVRKNIPIKVNPARWLLITTTILGIFVFALWRMKATHFIRSLIAATFYVAILWYLHSQYPLPGEVRGFYTLDAIRFKLFDSGPIPLFILGTFFAGLHYLIVIWTIRFMPLAKADFVEQNLINIAKQGDIRALEKALSKNEQQQGLDYYGYRISRLLDRFRSDQDLSAVIALKNDLLEIDEEDFANTFVSVTWAELALPLWGFLGTVVGVGEAIYNISNGAALIFRGGAASQGQDVLAHFNRGFQGMGVAFDTTFLGLGGVIIIGVFHTSLKKAFATRLAKARTLLAEIVEKFPTSSVEIVDMEPMGLLSTAVAGLADRMDELEHAMLKANNDTTSFRERMRYMFERVIIEDPDYQKIRDVLFVPIVEFIEVGKTLSTELEEHVKKELGHENWHIKALGIPTPSSQAGLAVIRDDEKKKDQLVTIGIGNKPSGMVETTEQLSRVYMENGGSNILVSLRLEHWYGQNLMVHISPQLLRKTYNQMMISSRSPIQKTHLHY